MRQRQQLLSLTDNLQVDNYHGLGYYLYAAQDCATDQGLKRLVLEDPEPMENLDFDLLCLDELQDATPIIYAFIRKLIRDNQSEKNLQYVVLGDPRQVSFGATSY
jgi:superfamily I DNA/RNA helicase